MNNPAALDRVRIVLSQTSHAGNIGAAARAMKTMGLSRLYLVRPKNFPHPDAEAFAAGAIDVLERATVCASLDEALKGTVLSVASTARRRAFAQETVDCREACRRLIVESQAGGVALVFGPERTGLTTRELNRCRLVATVPTHAAYPSMNLAQAVQVFAYELRMACGMAGLEQRAIHPATHEQIERFYAVLEKTLYEIRFLDPAHPRRMLQRLRRLFGRAGLEKEEVNILLGLLGTIRSKVE
ncbi:MAG: RNA methyltransferase [Gammaproteobacteria bacterium]